MTYLPEADAGTDGHQFALNPTQGGQSSQTAVMVIVTQAGNTNSYTITVTRNPASTDASLAGLSLSDGDLSPAFDTATDTYTTTVPASTGWVTVTAAATFEGAQIDISPADANLLIAGHQVDLAASPNGADNGTTDIDVTVTAEDQTTTGTYRVTVTRPPATNFHGAARVINTRQLGLDWIRGIWSDGQTIFVANGHLFEFLPADIFAVDIATGTLVGDLGLGDNDKRKPSNFDYATDVCSDGESMWALDRWGAVFRHDLVAGEFYELAPGAGEEVFDSVSHYQDRGIRSESYGMWCDVADDDGGIIWVVNSGKSTTKVRAFDRDTGERLRESDIAIYRPVGGNVLDWGNYGANDMWSDGTTAWVVYRKHRLARAYDLDTGGRRSHLDLVFRDWNTGMTNPKGIWSDGGMMWISSFNLPYPRAWSPSRIFGYYLPTEAALASLSVSDADIGSFSPWDTSYTATVAGSTGTVTVEAAAQHDDASVVILPADADPVADGHQVSLENGDNTITITSGTYNHTMTYTVTVTR